MKKLKTIATTGNCKLKSNIMHVMVKENSRGTVPELKYHFCFQAERSLFAIAKLGTINFSPWTYLLALHDVVPHGCSAEVDMKISVAASHTH